MKNLYLVLLLSLLAFSCSKNKDNDATAISATVNGESWIADEIITQNNTQGKLDYIEAKAADNSRMVFRLLESNLDLPSNHMPVDIDGNQLINELKIDVLPNLAEIDFSVKVSGIQAAVDFFVVERSFDDGLTFEEIYNIELGQMTSLSESFSVENTRTSDNSFVFYRGKLIYEDQTSWTSEMTIGSTSFRGSYDKGITKSQVTGNFTLTDYSSSSISGNFSFDTDDSEIRQGVIDGLKF